MLRLDAACEVPWSLGRRSRITKEVAREGGGATLAQQESQMRASNPSEGSHGSYTTVLVLPHQSWPTTLLSTRTVVPGKSSRTSS